jgi:hypothetical protein
MRSLQFPLAITGRDALKSRCPFYSRKQTLLGDSWMSALCQKQTLRTAVRLGLFDHLVGGDKKTLKYRDAQRFGGF